MPEVPPRNGAAELSLLMGLVAAAFSFFPIIGELIAAPACVLAVVCGYVAISRVERGIATHEARAWWGIGLGLSAGFVTFLVFVASSDVMA
jgi:hypothetical protein